MGPLKLYTKAKTSRSIVEARSTVLGGILFISFLSPFMRLAYGSLISQRNRLIGLDIKKQDFGNQIAILLLDNPLHISLCSC